MGWFVRLGLLAAFGSLAWIAGPVLGYRFGLNEFGTVFEHFSTMKGSLGKGLILGGIGWGALAGLAGLFSGRAGTGLLALLITAAGAASVYYGPISMAKAGAGVPPIHDISTDTDNPPVFVEVLPLREGAKNPAAYDTEQTAQQLEAYPDVKTIVVGDKTYDEVFAAAQAALQGLGVNIIAANKQDGRLEAVWTSTAFQFKDDIVVRIMPGEGGVFLIDVRSKSRFGRSDIGMNAKRIREFMVLFEAQLISG